MLLFLPDASNVHHHMMPRLVAVVELELVLVSFVIESRIFPGVYSRSVPTRAPVLIYPCPESF